MKYLCIEDSTMQLLDAYAESLGKKFLARDAYRISTGQWNVAVDEEVWGVLIEVMRLRGEDADETVQRLVWEGMKGRMG